MMKNRCAPPAAACTRNPPLGRERETHKGGGKHMKEADCPAEVMTNIGHITTYPKSVTISCLILIQYRYIGQT